MILRLALRSLSTRPLRTAVLAVGFGLGIGVMVELLGVGEVILEQAHAPVLQGGGDLVATGAAGEVDSARFLVVERARIQPVPVADARDLAVEAGHAVPAGARSGDRDCRPWRRAEPRTGDWRSRSRRTSVVGRHAGRYRMDEPSARRRPARHGSIPRPVPASEQKSWAEWLYFNGKSRDGSLRFYLTFMTGAPDPSGKRPMFVRLQLTRAGRKTTNYSATATVDERELLERAPDLDVGANRVRLDGLRYRFTLSLASESAPTNAASALTGEIALEAAPDRSLPPAVIHGAHGWLSGYVVPVLSGTFRGALRVGGDEVSVEGAAGYHDHNWGFWEGVRWQWGQVAGHDISLVYGRVFPPATVADASRLPGFLGVLGPEGPIAFSTDVSIEEEDRGGGPEVIAVHARGPNMELTLRF